MNNYVTVNVDHVRVPWYLHLLQGIFVPFLTVDICVFGFNCYYIIIQSV